jgi:hypothetical protein
VQFRDNARGQWKLSRGWFGTFVENVVQGVARDLLAAAIDRCVARGIRVVFHCHDEVTVEVPTGTLSDGDFLAILREPPPWAEGLPLNGKVHSGPHYLEAPKEPATPLPMPESDNAVLEHAVDEFIEEIRDDIGPIDDPTQVEREDDEDFVANLPDEIAPLTDLIGQPLSSDNKVNCPFHADEEPSCTIYPDHFHCYGCGEHGSRLDWLMRVEGMTEEEAVTLIKDWPGPSAAGPQNGRDTADDLAFIEAIWRSAQPLLGSIGEYYLDETRGIDITKLPAAIHDSLRFHPRCVFGPGTYLPCLIALMRDPLTDAPVGVQRIALEQRNGRIEKIGRMMLGRAGVVKLWPAGEQLAVGEGLETTLAVATRITYESAPLTPAWAALSTTGMRDLPIIPGVERLVLLVDNDANQKGQMAAACAAVRWRNAGRAVVPLLPPATGTDFNDMFM